MNRFYRKPKPETMRKNREFYKKTFSKEIEWCKEHLNEFKDNKFLVDMYTILITGSRKMTPKMIGAIQKAMTNPIYDPVLSLERREKIKPIEEKIHMVLNLVEMVDKDKDQYYKDNYSSVPFIKSLLKQLKTKLSLTEKQMSALNKIYKKYNNKLKGDSSNDRRNK
tara:strand:- start:882 stop:1379 length:498 start_codon:yes stop_codon:yes gene_type:complete